MQTARASVLAAALAGLAGTAAAQGTGAPFTGTADRPTFPVPAPETPVLTLDRERLFAESAFGQRVAAEIEAASQRLAAENRRIEAELSAEERELTERRPDLPPAEFRALADAFDEKAVRFRRTQDAKARALQRRDDQEREVFLRAALPILTDLVGDLGAVALLDARSVLLSSQSIDITGRAVARIDAEIGDGADLSPDGPILPEDPPLDDAPDRSGEGDPGGSAEGLPPAGLQE